MYDVRATGVQRRGNRASQASVRLGDTGKRNGSAGMQGIGCQMIELGKCLSVWRDEFI